MVPFFMRKKSCQKDWPRVPERFEWIQVNGCGAPDCENFDLSPVPEERICKESNRETDDRQIPEMPEPFRIQGTGLNSASLTCKSCEARKQSGEYSGSITSALKSNQAVAQELHRIWINTRRQAHKKGPVEKPPTLSFAQLGQARSTLGERLAIRRPF